MGRIEETGRPEGSEEQAGYTRAMQELGGRKDQKIYPVRRRWLWACISAACLLALLSGVVYARATLRARTANPPTQSFHVTGTPLLVVKGDSGTLTIHQGVGDTVSVSTQEQKEAGGNGDDFHVSATQNAQNPNEIDIVATRSVSDTNDELDIDVTLPATSAIHAEIGAGRVTIDGVSGQMDIAAGAATLGFTNGTLAGDSDFRTAAGTIAFRGALAPNGNYTFETSAGTVDLALPADAAFTLDATTLVGVIDNAFGSDSVGSNPTSQVHIRTVAGTITISKQ